MELTGSKLKYKKAHCLFLKSFASGQKKQQLQQKTFDHFRLISGTCGPLRYNEYESLRRILSRKLYRLLRFNLLKRPYAMITSKPKEMRMGKGKGSFNFFYLPVKSGLTVSRIFWCHRYPFFVLLCASKNAAKKSNYRFFF